MNFSEHVDVHAENMPDHPALVFEDQVITYSELLGKINRLSNALVKLGVSRGDRVAILMGNRPEFVVSYFAIMRIGAIAVTLNPMSTVYELSHYFLESKPIVVICKSEQIPKLEKLRDRDEHIKGIICVEPLEGALVFEEIMKDYPDDFKAVETSADDPASVIFTAGLLGKAFGATLSHSNLDSNSVMLRDVIKGGPESRVLSLIPMFHAFGCSANLNAGVKAGATVYLVEKVDFPKLIPWLQQARITYTGLVPMVYYGLLYHPSCADLDLSSLTVAISGGAPLAMEIYEKFTERYKIDLYQGYGLTEASPVVSWNEVNLPNKPHTVGVPIPKTEVQAHDENGNPTSQGVDGEIVVRGPNVMLGYMGRPNETERVIRNGWLYTGDIGNIDQDGYITLTGLKKDLIITSGFNVYCQEVEEIIIRHPHVADVALKGVDDLMRGQIIEALVIPEPNTQPMERDIMRFCKEYLSRYKCPRKVSFVKELIRDDNGKVVSWS
jgi:long-chain acyl-CoA synthetase